MMIDVTALYGPKGTEASGDEYVAEILQRTIGEQPSAIAAFNTRVSQLMSNGSLVSNDLPLMVVVHTELIAACLWQMATCYVDAVVAEFVRTGEDFGEFCYSVADAMCDSAGQWSRSATRVRSLMGAGSKVRLSQLLQLPEIKVNASTICGAWAVYDFVTGHVENLVKFMEDHGNVPRRLNGLYKDLLRDARVHLAMMVDVRKGFAVAMVVQNRVDMLREARSHAEALFEIAQKLWAPFLMGAQYNEAIRKPLGLDELELGGDPWMLTDPEKRKEAECHPERKAELAEFWSSVENVRETADLAHQIAELRRNDAIRRRTGRGYPMVPWPSQFLVRRSITLSGRTFRSGDLIAFYVKQIGEKSRVEVRRTGRVAKQLELLGQLPEEQV